VAVTGGVNRLPPVGLMLFSVGDGAGADVVVVVVVVVVLDGLSLPPPPHAVSVPIATIAAPPAITARRRPKRCEFMYAVLASSCCGERRAAASVPGERRPAA
jgi:hypothetical protein